ncbi:MAG TPA: hypothetical protein VMF89_05590, partial [Polyangiales bacterium]|nr:hypothetical protein [Polyangiales bacterium]
KTRTEDNTECCYALQDKVWIEDPDGNEWEVFVVKGEVDAMACETTTSGCCVSNQAAKQQTKSCCG